MQLEHAAAFTFCIGSRLTDAPQPGCSQSIDFVGHHHIEDEDKSPGRPDQGSFSKLRVDPELVSRHLSMPSWPDATMKGKKLL